MPAPFLRNTVNAIQWKSKQLKRYREVGLSRFNTALAIREVLDSGFKVNNRENYRTKLKKYYLDRYGIDIPSELDPLNLEEVLVDGVYSKYSTFIPKEGETVIDVGTQYGDFALLCTKVWKAGKVYSFEPMPKNYAITLRTLELNEASNVELKNAAVGSVNGYASLENGETMARVIGARDIGDIELITIDSLKLTSVDLIKIDAEGYEMEVLEGAKKTLASFHPKVIIEIHSKELKQRVLSFMEDVAYGLIYSDKPKLRPELELNLTQNLFFLPREF